MTHPIANALTPLNPTYLSLDNESQNHAGYYEGKQSHFKLIIVSNDFIGKRLLARHQRIYELLDPFFIKNGGQLHAIAIHAYTPDEWQAKDQAPQSPLCASQQPNSKPSPKPHHIKDE